MKSLVLDRIKSPLVLVDREVPEPDNGEVTISLSAAALNRRDFWITQGMYPGIRLPVILGSDGAGIVSQVGPGVSDDWLGREVMINPGWHWGDDPSVQSPQFQILGMPHDGTFASHVTVPVESVHAKPSHLDLHQAAALPLAGVTAYRATFTRGHLSADDHVLITGIGGGVATFALQYAVAVGASAFVTSSSPEKIARAIALGAVAGYDYRAEDWHQQLKAEHEPVSLIIDGAGGDGYARLIDVAAPAARIVNYGATAGPPSNVELFKVFWKQLNLAGSTMGSPADFTSMLKFVAQHQIVPIVDHVHPLADGNAALQRMRSSDQFGKIVLATDA
ncbi:MAG: zinc-binding dehydrogenase [Pirellulaceae bacterium]|nr:zinc-binding dehydrogenase [Planctomycetales bacterium]